MRRRAFLQLLTGAGLAATLPTAAWSAPACTCLHLCGSHELNCPASQEDGYSEAFFSRARERVVALVREQGRDIHRLEFAPPAEENGHRFRVVKIQLEAGGSLLQRCCWEWREYF